MDFERLPLLCLSSITFPEKNIFKNYPHTSLAILCTNAILAHCSSSVSLLPISQDAKPHCGLRQSCSKGMYFAASCMRWIIV